MFETEASYAAFLRYGNRIAPIPTSTKTGKPTTVESAMYLKKLVV